MSNRKDWQSSLARVDVLDAAKKRVAHHTARLSFWKSKKSEVMDTIKREGLTVEESVAGANYTTSNAVAQRHPQVMVRNDLQKDLDECATRIYHHQNELHDFQVWVDFLSAEGPSMLDLDRDDYKYFFIYD